VAENSGTALEMLTTDFVFKVLHKPYVETRIRILS
jgi:hypothetical protein